MPEVAQAVMGNSGSPLKHTGKTRGANKLAARSGHPLHIVAGHAGKKKKGR